MKPSFHFHFRWTVVAAVFLLARAIRVAAQEEPRWLTLKSPTAFAETDVETETITESVGNTHYDSDLLYLAPTLGLNLSGSIYHPNLLQFDLKGQGGYIQQDISAHGTGENASTHQTSFLQNYDVNLIFLASKPYAGGFSAARTHTFEELDMFNQAIVDTQSYGGHVGYAAGPVPFSIALKHLDQDETGMQYNSTYKQDDLSANASNNRKNGTTTLSWDIGQYYQETAGFSQNESYQYGTLLDTEKFGRDNHLDSSLTYNQDASESGQEDSTRNLMLQEDLTFRHSEAWQSFYNYNFNDAYSEPTETDSQYGVIGLRNQLFQSLASEWDVHGSLQDSTAPDASASANMYGVANSETYNKRLGDWGRLTIGNSVRYDITQENNSGVTTSVLNEQHVLKDGTPTFLSQPLVVAVAQVTDPTGAHLYLQGIDYTYFKVGPLTEIERVPTSLSLTNGSTVLVNYTVQSQPSGSYSTFSDQCQIRLDLFNGLIGVYSEIGTVDNHSAEDFVLENTFNTLSGVDVTWRWLQAGGSYETQEGNLIAYNALSTYQSATFRPSTTAAISINGRERWSRYPQENLAVNDYTLTTRFSDQLGSRLQLSVEAGVWNEQGGPLAQTLLTAGAHLRYNIGKLSLSLAYQFNQQTTISGANLRNFASLTLRRDF